VKWEKGPDTFSSAEKETIAANEEMGSEPFSPSAADTTTALSEKGSDPISATNVKSIAVLPFADLSQAHDQEWFADGLAEEILNSLAKTPDLLVASRTSSFRYKKSELDLPQIAAE